MAAHADLLADLLAPFTDTSAERHARATPAKPANPAKNEDRRGLARDSNPCEGLRIAAKAEVDSQGFAGVRNVAIQPASEQWCGVSQVSHDSQGVPVQCTSFAVPHGRAYRLKKDEVDAAHAEPWDDAACARFVGRVATLMRAGFSATDADDLAERLHLRDVEGDDRTTCIECRHWRGTRCAHPALRLGELGQTEAVRLRRCPGFSRGRP